MNDSLKTISVKVNCPDHIDAQTVYVDYCYHNGKPFYFPSNGCNNSNGSKLCQQCCATVTMALMNGEYTHDTPIIISSTDN